MAIFWNECIEGGEASARIATPGDPQGTSSTSPLDQPTFDAHPPKRPDDCRMRADQPDLERLGPVFPRAPGIMPIFSQ